MTLIVALLFLMRSPSGDCAGQRQALIVDTNQREIMLCDDGQITKSYAAAFGRGGFGKKKEGDLKTPLGAYDLGVPRKSASFNIFIPVGYPTRAQVAAGYTGNAVGVHGPYKSLPVPSALVTLTDWTLGCIAVGSDQEIEEIAEWVRKHEGVRIVIK